MSLRISKLPRDAKFFIVRALARRECHAVIVEQFGVTVDRQAIHHYNPAHNPKLDDELKSLYEKPARITGARWNSQSPREWNAAAAPGVSSQHQQARFTRAQQTQSTGTA